MSCLEAMNGVIFVAAVVDEMMVVSFPSFIQVTEINGVVLENRLLAAATHTRKSSVFCRSWHKII
jgi:hypothetical protein